MNNTLDKDDIFKLLKGRTMSVYALLITRGEMGVREIQRALNFSSPNLALHHVNKLIELDLVTKDVHGVYSVTRTVRIGSLSLFVKVGRWLLPRFMFLVTLFLTMLSLYLVFFVSWPFKGEDIMFISMTVVAIALILYESRRIWLLAPF